MAGGSGIVIVAYAILPPQPEFPPGAVTPDWNFGTICITLPATDPLSRYRLLYTEQLSPENWLPVQPGVWQSGNPGGGALTWTDQGWVEGDPAQRVPQRFYRLERAWLP